MNVPENWEHKSGYRLNADGKSIKYEHTERELWAIIECMINETDNCMEYCTVIFDENLERKKAHEIFTDKESAKQNLIMHMEYY